MSAINAAAGVLSESREAIEVAGVDRGGLPILRPCEAVGLLNHATAGMPSEVREVIEVAYTDESGDGR